MLQLAKRAIALIIVTVSLFTLQAEATAQTGRASWYALRSKTASGEACNPNALTAAHRSLPFGTRVKVTNLKNGREVVVRINDRGPFSGGRIIDLTKAAAGKLGFLKAGTALVELTILR
jgi:rare lipoprotein A